MRKRKRPLRRVTQDVNVIARRVVELATSKDKKSKADGDNGQSKDEEGGSSESVGR